MVLPYRSRLVSLLKVFNLNRPHNTIIKSMEVLVIWIETIDFNGLLKLFALHQMKVLEQLAKAPKWRIFGKWHCSNKGPFFQSLVTLWREIINQPPIYECQKQSAHTLRVCRKMKTASRIPELSILDSTAFKSETTDDDIYLFIVWRVR